MNIILLSGGSGKRLWPLSNEVRAKQFLKIFKTETGERESMLQRMYRMICEVDKKANITIATSENQIQSIRNQLDEKVSISVEPCRRDTFPAIALSTAYLHDICGLDKNEAVVVCPVDPYVDCEYFKTINKLYIHASTESSNITLMGVEPTYPSEKYGYIIPKSKDAVSKVSEFKEKPSSDIAKKYIESGALWNAGVFAYRIGYLLDIAEKYFGMSKYDELLDNYKELKKISFDYAVVEKEHNIDVIRFSGQWKDLGTWNTLTEEMSDEVSGNAVLVDSLNTHVINELQIPLIVLGTRNLAIAATPDGILVTDKSKSNKLKDVVPNQRPMFEKRIWGEYRVLDYNIGIDGQNYLTKHLIIKKGRHISYQRHKYRSEMWTVVDGTGKIIINDSVKNIKRGDTVCVKPGIKHGIKAESELHIIEVQIGNELTEEDIERLDWDWD